MDIKKQIDCILLIDDDEATNFLHHIVIEEWGNCKKIVCKPSAQEALDFLTTPIEGKYPSPELIFLDINMPGMNGWEFLEVYQNLREEERGDVVVVMLTTSLNPRDSDKANQLEVISGFKNKPLTEAILEDLLARYFQRTFNE